MLEASLRLLVGEFSEREVREVLGEGVEAWNGAEMVSGSYEMQEVICLFYRFGYALVRVEKGDLLWDEMFDKWDGLIGGFGRNKIPHMVAYKNGSTFGYIEDIFVFFPMVPIDVKRRI